MKNTIKTYTVAVYEEMSGNVQVKAKSLNEALKKAKKTLEEEGLNGFPDFNCKNRETDCFHA